MMSIDVEGHELPVLYSVDWQRQMPSIIIIELWSRPARQAINDEIFDFLSERGYCVAAICGADNIIFGHSDWIAHQSDSRQSG